MPEETFYIKQNDTKPVIRAKVLDSAGNVVNVTGAQATAQGSAEHRQRVQQRGRVGAARYSHEHHISRRDHPVRGDGRDDPI